MRNRRGRPKRSGGGGGGGIVTAIFIVAVLGGVAWFAIHQLRKGQEAPPEATGPRVTLMNWCSAYSLRGADANAIPDPLPDPWLVRLESTRRFRSVGGSEYPGSWVDIQHEGGRFTAIQISTYSGVSNEPGPFGLLREDQFSGLEAQKLSDLVTALGSGKDRSDIEGETLNFRFFGWRDTGGKGLRSSSVCAARKGRPAAEELLSKARAAWTSGAYAAAPTERPRSGLDVVLLAPGENRDALVLALVDLLGLGPAKAEVLVDTAPTVLKTDVPPAEAERIRAKIEAAGGKAEIR